MLFKIFFSLQNKNNNNRQKKMSNLFSFALFAAFVVAAQLAAGAAALSLTKPPTTGPQSPTPSTNGLYLFKKKIQKK
jgi:hypothetical protein